MFGWSLFNEEIDEDLVYVNIIQKITRWVHLIYEYFLVKLLLSDSPVTAILVGLFKKSQDY